MLSGRRRTAGYVCAFLGFYEGVNPMDNVEAAWLKQNGREKDIKGGGLR